MTGTIIRLCPNRGYGFIRGTDRVSRFFHANDVVPPSAFDIMHEGQEVVFESVKGRKPDTLRAVEIKPCSTR